MSTLLLSLALLAAPADPVVARVDGEAIPASALLRRLEAERARGADRTPAEVIQALVDDALLYAYGRASGLAATPELRAKLEDERRRLAAEAFIEQELDGAVKPDEADLRRAYHAGADTVRVSTIVVASREKALALVDRLRKGASFREEAKHSLDARARAAGGDLGPQTRAALDPALAEAAFSASPGTLVGPIALKNGFAVAQVAEVRLADEAGFAARREGLAQFVAQQQRRAIRRHYLDRARAAAGAKLDEAFLRSTGTRLEASPEEAAHVLAEVRGRALTYAMVLPEVQRLARGQAGSHTSGTAVKLEVARMALDGFLLEDAAIARGFGDSPAVHAKLAELEREAVIAAAVAQARRGAEPASDADLQAQYAAHPSAYARPGRRECAHVLVASEKEASEVRARAARGEPFADLARQLSLDRDSAAAGGRLGVLTDEQVEQVARGGEPALAKALREAPAGAPGAPVRSRSGWHVLRCEARVPPGPAPFAEVLPAVAAAVSEEKAAAAVRRLVARLREKATVTVNEDAVTRAAKQRS